MDESKLKRLLIILAVSIIAIMVIKKALTKAYTNLNNAAAIKRQAASTQPSAPPQASATPTAAITETPAATSVGEPATVESSASSGVSETR